MKEAEKGEALRFVADGYDTLTVPLGTLDTTVDVKLTKIATEQTYAFGYPLKNEPTPSKGCGKDNTLKNYFKFKGGGIEHEVYLDLPENYDKNKPYRLVFGMHCMGGSAQNVAKNEHYYGYRDKDKKNTIFVAPHGYTDQMPWRCGDNKDHLFFDEILTYLNENLCVDTSRVFSSGFSFGAMYSNSLAQTFQHRLRGVVVFATADQVIYIPKNAGKPIAWMGTVGLSDGTCPPSMGRSARDRILRNNGPEGHTDCTSEKATEFSGGGGHVCYDYKTVDPRFPVKWCTFNGGHQWDMRENGKLWASDIGWEFITQF
jgi:poly(3-hydroxybutyrate) depolymerase